MEEQVLRLVDKAWNRLLKTDPNKRLLIAIGGIPGSGKTTLSQTVTNTINARHAALHPSSPPIAAFVPMDGYHLTRAQLSAMPDPVTAQARRGAEFTFDGAGFLQLVEALRQPLTSSSEIIYAPSFDHAVKDPKEGDIPVGVQQRVVVFEGNCRFSYISVLRGSTNKEDVLLDKEPWFKAAALMDLRWFVEVDTEVARVRLARRHLAAGIVGSLEEGDRRAVENDLPNGEEVIRRRVEGIDEVVKSVEDGGWVHP